MDNMTHDDSDEVNDSLALALGWDCIEIAKNSTLHSIWQGPLGIKYYELFVPQFCNSRKYLHLLIKAMAIAGYTMFNLQKMGKRKWISSFSCPHGPCDIHDSQIDDCHGSSVTFGINPGQAASFAAIKALASGTQITRMPFDDDMFKQVSQVQFNIKKLLKIIDKHERMARSR